MAQSETNTNTANNNNINGTTRVPFEMPTARSRNHFLQQNSVGRRLIAGPEQYVTPPTRVRIWFLMIPHENGYFIRYKVVDVSCCVFQFVQAIPSSSSTQNIAANQFPCPKVQKSRSMSSFQQSVALSEITPYAEYSAASQSTDGDTDFVQCVIYALTGIEGKYFKKDVITGGLKLDAKVRVSAKHSAILLRLAEVAYYHEQLISFTDPSTGRTPLGLLGQGLVTALKHELTKYYGMVAMLQEQVSFNIPTNIYFRIVFG